MVKEIPITRGYTVLVDDDDYEWISRYNWQAKPKRNKVYACRRAVKHGVRQTTILMHREILKALPGQITDHINGNSLDNRKENLRIVTQQENCMNRAKINKPKSSIYKGVYWNKRDKLWCVQLKVEGKRKHIGYYKYEKDAGKAYNEAAEKYFGVYAKLNDI